MALLQTQIALLQKQLDVMSAQTQATQQANQQPQQQVQQQTQVIQQVQQNTQQIAQNTTSQPTPTTTPSTIPIPTPTPISTPAPTPVCTPNWQCSAYSTCTNSQQTRTCNDLNNCNTANGEPNLSQSCLMPVPPSNDDTVSNLTVNGTTVSNFSPSTISYNVVLPADTTIIPKVAGILNDSKAIEIVTQPTGVTGGSAKIQVIAQDETNQTYTINFSLAPSLPALTITSQPASGMQDITSYSRFANENCTGPYYCSVNMLKPLDIIAKITLLESNAYGTFINSLTFTFQGVPVSSTFLSDAYQPFHAPKNIMLINPLDNTLVGYGRVTGSNEVTFYFPPSSLGDYGLLLQANKPKNLSLVISSSALMTGATGSQTLNVSISGGDYTQFNSNNNSEYKLSGTPILVASVTYPQ